MRVSTYIVRGLIGNEVFKSGCMVCERRHVQAPKDASAETVLASGSRFSECFAVEGFRVEGSSSNLQDCHKAAHSG